MWLKYFSLCMLLTSCAFATIKKVDIIGYNISVLIRFKKIDSQGNVCRERVISNWTKASNGSDNVSKVASNQCDPKSELTFSNEKCDIYYAWRVKIGDENRIGHGSCCENENVCLTNDTAEIRGLVVTRLDSEILRVTLKANDKDGFLTQMFETIGFFQEKIKLTYDTCKSARVLLGSPSESRSIFMRKTSKDDTCSLTKPELEWQYQVVCDPIKETKCRKCDEMCDYDAMLGRCEISANETTLNKADNWYKADKSENCKVPKVCQKCYSGNMYTDVWDNERQVCKVKSLHSGKTEYSGIGKPECKLYFDNKPCPTVKRCGRCQNSNSTWIDNIDMCQDINLKKQTKPLEYFPIPNEHGENCPCKCGICYNDARYNFETGMCESYYQEGEEPLGFVVNEDGDCSAASCPVVEHPTCGVCTEVPYVYDKLNDVCKHEFQNKTRPVDYYIKRKKNDTCCTHYCANVNCKLPYQWNIKNGLCVHEFNGDTYAPEYSQRGCGSPCPYVDDPGSCGVCNNTMYKWEIDVCRHQIKINETIPTDGYILKEGSLCPQNTFCAICYEGFSYNLDLGVCVDDKNSSITEPPVNYKGCLPNEKDCQSKCPAQSRTKTCKYCFPGSAYNSKLDQCLDPNGEITEIRKVISLKTTEKCPNQKCTYCFDDSRRVNGECIGPLGAFYEPMEKVVTYESEAPTCSDVPRPCAICCSGYKFNNISLYCESEEPCSLPEESDYCLGNECTTEGAQCFAHNSVCARERPSLNSSRLVCKCKPGHVKVSFTECALPDDAVPPLKKRFQNCPPIHEPCSEDEPCSSDTPSTTASPRETDEIDLVEELDESTTVATTTPLGPEKIVEDTTVSPLQPTSTPSSSDVIILEPVDPCPQPQISKIECDPDEIELNEFCYYKSPKPVGWISAEMLCRLRGGHLLQIRNALQERKVRISVGIDEDTWIGIHYLQNELDNDDLDNFNETDIALDRSFNNSAEDLPILGHMDKSNDGVWRYVLDLQKIDEANSYLQERGLPESLSEQECIYITPEGEFSNAMCNEKLQFVCMRDSWTQVVVDSNPLSGAQMSSIASLAV